jgi:hypothetical protein
LIAVGLLAAFGVKGSAKISLRDYVVSPYVGMLNDKLSDGWEI